LRYWLLKSEPSVYGIEDLERDGVSGWEGVRNYQARNFIRDDMREGDGVLFYHSSCDRIGVAGLARIARAGYPDPTQFEAGHKYQDSDSDPSNPRWYRVDVAFVERFNVPLSLEAIKADPALEGMLVTRRGQRLSVQPVEPEHYERVIALARGGANG
jgi:predicted RNA-binding protein with PUA-like domain